jgi:hypothetical protein
LAARGEIKLNKCRLSQKNSHKTSGTVKVMG